jgi:hypothetical protein
MDEQHDKRSSILTRDPLAAALFGVALILMLFIFLGEATLARSGHPDLLRIALIATAVFAAAGVLLGLARSLRKRPRT